MRVVEGLPDDVLEVTELEKHFPLRRSLLEVLRRAPPERVRAVDGVDLTLRHSRTLGLVGESGSGKTTVARCIIGLAERSGGEMTLLDIPLAPALTERDPSLLRLLRMVFQNPEEALNPYLTVGETLSRTLRHTARYRDGDTVSAVEQLLWEVRLPPTYRHRMPGQLSGGEKQRVAIARAFASRPELLLFDESVSALDVSVQATILNLLNDLQHEEGSAYLFISHDLAVVGYLADEIAVIYLGRLMEVGPTERIFQPPHHPYTEALLSAIPVADPSVRREPIRLGGEIPSPGDVPTGCPFHTRCPRFLGDICINEEPPWREGVDGHRIYCHIPLQELQTAQEWVG
jgi:peptide/nickel transport system ATP-binding protein